MSLLDRLMIINRFNLLCIFYTIPYILFSIWFQFYSSALVFFCAQLVFIASLYFNSVQKFWMAKIAVIIGTNFSVFYLGLFYGFSSGFHLYYFTSPLIVLSLFGFEGTKNFVAALSIYLSTVLCLIVLYMLKFQAFELIDPAILDKLYVVNVILALSFCVLIASNFANFNKRITEELKGKNTILEHNERQLRTEIAERILTEEKLQDSLKNVEILLSETHHRVKNNLAVISGMLDLQIISKADDQLKSILTDSRNRIKSMSLIHESLYQYSNLSQIEFGKYLTTLTNEIKKSYPSVANTVEVVRSFDEVFLPVTQAIPLGLLVNEVLSNIYKHAFKDKKEGRIDMALRMEGTTVLLAVKDNGPGFDPAKVDSSKSIGTSLIDAFSKQLRGKYCFTNDNGSVFTITFENKS